MEKELFTIHPLEGFGLLQFGQSIAAARDIAPFYGEIKWDQPRFNEQRWLEWGEELRQDPYLTEEDVIDMLGRYRESRIDVHNIDIGQHIDLWFYENQLLEIRMGNVDLPAYLGDQDLFSLVGESATRYIAEHLQENPYMWERGMFFVNHSLVMDNYYDEIENGKITWSGASVKPGDRSIFLTPPSGELVGPYAFDPSETPIYKVI